MVKVALVLLAGADDRIVAADVPRYTDDPERTCGVGGGALR